MSKTLRTLGAVALYATDGETLLLGPGKPLALLLFLACAPARRVSRESLIDLLWSDLEPERARPALRQTLFLLRRLLGDDVIVGNEELALAFSVSTDRDAFLSSLDRGDLDGALALYRGAFLPSFGVPGGVAFEQWADLERNRLESGYVRAAELLVRRMMNESRLKEARTLARHVRDRLPEVEAAGRLLIEACLANGDFIAAIMEADSLEQRAHADDTSLDASTRSAIARARRKPASGALTESRHTLIAELTGREREFHAITSAWDAVRTGPARHFHLNAPAGFGKTRLLRDAILRLAAAGAHIAEVRGSAGNRDVPYAFASDLAAELLKLPGAAGIAPASAAALLALNPALSGQLRGAVDLATGEEALRRRMLAIADLAQSVADEHRFVLAIDDLHWIDAQSFRVLEGLWTRLGSARMLCLTASRPERSPGSPTCVTLSLPALDVTQVSALVSGLGALPDDQRWSNGFVATLCAATSGSPLLILETLHLALEQQILSLSDNGWQCADETQLSLVLRAGEAVRARVRSLRAQPLQLLAMLTTAGEALDAAALATLSQTQVDSVTRECANLERAGLVRVTAAGWIPEHDEIADAAWEILPADEQQRCKRGIGEYLAERAADVPTRLVRACQLLNASGEELAVQRHFRRFVAQSRLRGDRRSFAVLAGELLGTNGSPAQINGLVRSLPPTWRIGLWSRARQTAAACVVAVLPFVAIGVAQARMRTDPAQPRLFFADSAGVTSNAVIHADDFDGRKTPLTRSVASSPLAEPARNYANDAPALSPDAQASAWTQETGDSTILDIWLRTANGVRRLTSNVRDDVVHSWLPDGSALVGTTNRWAAPGHGDYDVAVFDTATGAARQITRGTGHDGHPHASLDGTRIAFIRQKDGAPHQLCVVWVDGSAEAECRWVENAQVSVVLGWTSLSEIAIISEIANAPGSVMIYDWSARTYRSVLKSNAHLARLSPDRKWIVATVRADGIDGARDWLAPVDRPDNARPIDATTATVSPARWWEGPTDRSLLIDHIEFTDTTSSAMLGVISRQSVRALTVAGVEIPLLAPVRWSSSNDQVATIDSLGQIHGHNEGDVTITASLVSWRAATKHVRIRRAITTTVIEENWQDDWNTRWITFGEPHPIVKAGPEGVRGFYSRGDGVFLSVGTLRRALDAKGGIGVEMRVSTPLTQTENQQFAVALVSGIDTAALAHGSSRMKPQSVGNPNATCGFDFPLTGALGQNRIVLSGGSPQGVDLGVLAKSLRSGGWWTLYLQLFPDGRCGVAINGRVVSVSANAIDLKGDFRLWLGNSSLGTTILHGPLKIWTGVRTDIEWTAAR